MGGHTCPRRLSLVGEPAATIDLTWHRYCPDAYRVASGQHPGELQRTMCEVCAGPSDEVDHRLSANVASALGHAALRRAFTLGICAGCAISVIHASTGYCSATGGSAGWTGTVCSGP